MFILGTLINSHTYTAFSETPLSNQFWPSSLQALLIVIRASKLSTQLKTSEVTIFNYKTCFKEFPVMLFKSEREPLRMLNFF